MKEKITKKQLEDLIEREGLEIKEAVKKHLLGKGIPEGKLSVSSAYQENLLRWLEEAKEGRLSLDLRTSDAFSRVLFVAVRYRALNALRRKRKWNDLSPDAEIEFHESLRGSETNAYWMERVSHIEDEETREVAKSMFDFERAEIRRSATEIAELLGMTPRHVYYKMSQVFRWIADKGPDWFGGLYLS